MDGSILSQEQKTISVLLVDDDITYVKIIQHHLQKYRGKNFKITWKESVEDALHELEHNSAFDIILTDYNFPASNGLEFCLQLNQMDCRIPIVFLTGTRDFKLVVEAMKLGVEDFLVKEDLGESHVPRTIVNVIERVQMRNQMQAVEKRLMIAENRAQAIRELVVTVCHEFNNPLAAVKISADLVQRSLTSEDDLRLLLAFEENFLKIEKEIKRLRDINFDRSNVPEAEKNQKGEYSTKAPT